MNAVILSVGDEVLEGDTVNSDAAYIAKVLINSGINVLYHKVISDDDKLVKENVIEALNAADMLITSGGLGPTKDDLTKKSVCEAMGLKMYFDSGTESFLKDYFARLHSTLSENNFSQCYMPVGGTILKNDNGTAPGVFVEKNGKYAAMLPGPPAELVPMLTTYLAPILMQLTKKAFYERYYMLTGVGEGPIEEKLRSLKLESGNYILNTYITECGVLVKVTAKAPELEDAVKLADKNEEALLSLLHEYIYAISDEKQEVWETVYKLLREKKLTVSFAESCTGGLIAETLTSFPGASEVFTGCAVTYSNEAKTKLLGVKPETLDSFGAVSEQTAREMAEGARELFDTDISAAVTGIAGPGGGSAEKPVGLVYYAVCDKNGTKVFKGNFRGSRDKIRTRAMAAVFKQIFELIK